MSSNEVQRNTFNLVGVSVNMPGPPIEIPYIHLEKSRRSILSRGRVEDHVKIYGNRGIVY